MTAFLVFTAAAVGTYLIRLSGVWLLGGDRELPERVTRALRLVGPAAMAAIIANALLLEGSEWRTFGAWHLAALVAVGVALWRRTMGITIAAGVAAFAVLLATGL